jgi:septal ring factor EnvC (AmiA/AmiB activator)
LALNSVLKQSEGNAADSGLLLKLIQPAIRSLAEAQVEQYKQEAERKLQAAEKIAEEELNRYKNETLSNKEKASSEVAAKAEAIRVAQAKANEEIEQFKNETQRIKDEAAQKLKIAGEAADKEIHPGNPEAKVLGITVGSAAVTGGVMAIMGGAVASGVTLFGASIKHL